MITNSIRTSWLLYKWTLNGRIPSDVQRTRDGEIHPAVNNHGCIDEQLFPSLSIVCKDSFGRGAVAKFEGGLHHYAVSHNNNSQGRG